MRALAYGTHRMAPTNTSLPQYVDYLADAGTGQRYAWSDASISVNLGGLGDSAVMLASAKLALQAWTLTTGIVFTTTTGAADITFDNEEAGSAYTSTSFTSAGEIRSAEINVGKDWMDGFPVDQRWGEGSYGLQTFIHEIGHALGLNHGGPYNGDGDFATDAIFAIDTYQYSVMSYFDQSNYGDATDLFVATPMLADIAAIRELYGAQPINVGDTAYGRSGFYDFAKYPDTAFTISDSAGFDTIDLRGLGTGARLNLNAGAFSDINGHVKNLAIAQGAAIERAYGTESADTITGDAAANQLYGFGGADILSGGDGNDILQGGAGDDRLNGGNGADRLWSGAGSDRLTGGTGADQFLATTTSDYSGDVILDFTSGIDRIVLSNFDADPALGGDQAFRFLGASAFDHHAGALVYAFALADTFVRGDIDGDGRTDFSIRLDHEIALTARDFIL